MSRSFLKAVYVYSVGCRYYNQTRSVSLVPFSEVTGTMGYIAPEIMNRTMYDTAVDMWSLGVLLFQVCAHCAVPHTASSA